LKEIEIQIHRLDNNEGEHGKANELTGIEYVAHTRQERSIHCIVPETKIII
jgi:hypothetical protein